MKRVATELARQLKKHQLTQERAATHLHVSRLSISQLLNDRRSLTVDMAARLQRLFGKPSLAYWLQLQVEDDIDELRESTKHFERIRPL